MNARDLSERPQRDDAGMPPFVVGAELPKDFAHATKEPSLRRSAGAFLEVCCTKGTEPWFCGIG